MTESEEKTIPGLRYERLRNFVKLVRTMQESNMDMIMPITGPKGIGKSTFEIVFSREYVKQYMAVNNYNPEEWIAFDHEDLKTKIHTLPPFSPILADEAIRFAYNLDWNTKESKELVKLLTQSRPKRQIIFMAVPGLESLQKAFRRDLITFWVHIIKKGFAMVFKPNLAPNTEDPFMLKKVAEIFGFFSYHSDPNQVIRRLMALPTFEMYITFPELPKELYQRYDTLRNEAVFKEDAGVVHKGDALRATLYNLRNNWVEFQASVAQSRDKTRPSFRLFSEELCRNPLNNVPLYSSQSLAQMVNSFARNIEARKTVLEGNV